jgi:hypothetical protein
LARFEKSTLRRYRLVFALGVACLAVGAILRAVLWWRFGLPAGGSGWALPAILAGAYFQIAYELFTAHHCEPSDAPDPALTAAQGVRDD